ncbi:MAG TPA: hypothetical protein VGK56_04670, partial [Anaerolineales bacterium]
MFLLQRTILVLALSLTTLGSSPAQSALAQEERAAPLDQFDLIDETSGWILSGTRLLWTSDMGDTWDEIGPSVPTGADVHDVEFLNTDTGWMLWSRAEAEGSSSFQLAQTTDHGVSWVEHSLALFEPGEVASFAEKAEMGWLNEQHGWIAIKQATGSNFSVGTLFVTSDGGSAWSRTVLPVADHVHFRDPQTGWAVGGPTGGQIFETKDGGETWQAVEVDKMLADSAVTAYLPSYANEQGVLVRTETGSENSLNIYSL